jgi:hypothetical protein
MGILNDWAHVQRGCAARFVKLRIVAPADARGDHPGWKWRDPIRSNGLPAAVTEPDGSGNAGWTGTPIRCTLQAMTPMKNRQTHAPFTEFNGPAREAAQSQRVLEAQLHTETLDAAKPKQATRAK